MQKRLIALRGLGGVGKSTTLHILYRLLLSEPGNKTLIYASIGRKLDFKAVVEILGCKVGLVNRGDNPKELKKHLTYLVAKNCDLIVCASRTKGAVSTVLRSYSPTFHLVAVKKSPCINSNHHISNLSAAHELASEVYSAIDA